MGCGRGPRTIYQYLAVEQTLFSKLHEAGKALFYWDYDTFYLNKHPHEAGEFIRRNLKNFPSELPPSLFDHLNHPKEITFIESPTETDKHATCRNGFGKT